MSGASPPQMSNDGALGVDAESNDFPRDQRLCRESESGQSEPS
jgi:hypothetical protein